MFTQMKGHATSIAGSVSKAKYGFDITILITIISALLPAIIKCFTPDNPAQARKYVEGRWRKNRASNEYGGYHPKLVKQLMINAKQAAVKEGQILNDEAAQEVAIKTLDHVRTGDDQTQASAIKEVYTAIQGGKY